MTNAGGCVDRTADPVDNAHRHPLSFARRVAKPVDDRIFARGEYLGRAIVAIFDRGGLTIDQATRPVFDTVIEKPGLAQHASPLGFDDVAVVLDREVDIIANATAERAGCILNDFEFGRRSRRCSGGLGHIVNQSVVGRGRQGNFKEVSTSRSRQAAGKFLPDSAF